MNHLTQKRTRALSLICLVAVALFACAAIASAKKAPPPTHLQVDAQEWSLWLSRSSVPAGKVSVQLWNRGQDAHDLRIRKLNKSGKMVGPVLGKVRTAQSGQIRNSTWTLKAGHYQIYCSMPGHMKMGMHAKLTVKTRHK